MKNGIEQLVGPMNLAAFFLDDEFLFWFTEFSERFSWVTNDCHARDYRTWPLLKSISLWRAAKRFTMMDRNWWCFFFFLYFSDNDSVLLSEQPKAPTQIFCNSQEQDKFLPDDGVESSLLMELNPGKTMNSCKRFFTAPEFSGLFIRLIRSNDSSSDATKLSNVLRGSFNNVSEYCPISIVSFLASTLTLPLKRSIKPVTHPHKLFSSNLSFDSLKSSQIRPNVSRGRIFFTPLFGNSIIDFSSHQLLLLQSLLLLLNIIILNMDECRKWRFLSYSAVMSIAYKWDWFRSM